MSNSKYYDGAEFVELGKDDLTTITPESIGASSNTHNHDEEYQAKSTLIRNIHVNTVEPTPQDGNDGDLWLVYEV